ncbi:GNAT family N-acetyltransferase [Phenylobacterium sp.]|uniref:GNAT family N-acetyltransferase n=1 Tax=Phenylobacterium sp. TaxID=1871053 RepID=UPI0025FE31B9|nr:GNAT family N-acetyltransferase [Phenylobacterium sp.]
MAGFDCGKPALNAWLSDRAHRNQDLAFTSVVVIHDDNKVVGFYGLSPTAVQAAALPRSVRTGQPPALVPCVLLGQLAVDRRWQGRGLASRLVLDAFRRASAAADLIGGRALLLHAIDLEAAAFWRAWGFIPSADDPLLLLRGLASIRASLDSAV